MEKSPRFDVSFRLQRLALLLFVFFPIALSILAQTLLVVHSWDFIKFLLFSFLVASFLIPIYATFAKDSPWASIERSKYLPVVWVVGLAIVLRIIVVQLISTDFVSDMEDVHFFAVDISSGHPMANLKKYPNIPATTHLNMSAFVLAFVYRLLGASPASAKLFLILLGGLTTFAIYLAGREIAGARVGLLAAFLFASLPSVLCYTGVLAGDHLALPLLVLSIFIFARTQNRDHPKISSVILPYALTGILVGLVDWFRPIGIILFVALFISVLMYGAGRWNFYRMLIVLGVLLLAYTQTSNLAVRISERFFQRDIRSASQRIGEFLLKGLNPESKGIVTLEDDTLANQAYQSFGNDSSGAQAYLIRLAISRVAQGQILDLFRDKFNLIWSSHDALFDYSLAGSNDEEFVNLLRAFETLLYLVITIFILIHAILCVRQRSGPAVFAMQLFILGFAFLLLLLEVQNRYVMVVIPYSILLGVMGGNAVFSIKASSTSPE